MDINQRMGEFRRSIIFRLRRELSRYAFHAPRLFVDAPLAAGAHIALNRDQANYLVTVLRLRHGEPILTFNGREGEWRAIVDMSNRKSPFLAIERRTRPQENAVDLDYLFAPLKQARLDYMIQKAVEMGVSRLRPVITRRTQTSRVNLSRMRANAIEAAEQCGVLHIPDIEAEQKLDKIIATWPSDKLLVFCDEDAEIANPLQSLAQTPAARSLAVLIGPEGGFEPSEREMLRRLPTVAVLSLGPRILRADTAAVAALAIVQAVCGDWNARRSGVSAKIGAKGQGGDNSVAVSPGDEEWFR